MNTEFGLVKISAESAGERALHGIEVIEAARAKKDEPKIQARMRWGRGWFWWHQEFTREEAIESLDDDGGWPWRSFLWWEDLDILQHVRDLASEAVDQGEDSVWLTAESISTLRKYDKKATRVYAA